MHNRRLCEQELESIVVNLESVFKGAIFFLGYSRALLRRPIGAIRRPGGHTFYMAHERLPWYTRAPGIRVVPFARSPSDTKAADGGPHIKKVCPSGRLIAPIGLLRRAWLQPRQKARLQNRFQSNNNRFKLLLPQPSLLQLRLTILTKQGCEECSRDTLLLQ